MELNEHPFPKKATTYVAFSHDGTELLVNLGSEQVRARVNVCVCILLFIPAGVFLFRS